MASLTPIVPIVAGCIAGWLIAVGAGGPSAEVFFGMAGPLVAVVTTWWLVVRAHRINAASVTPVLIVAFAGKLVFFGAYVVVVTRAWDLEIIPFAASFVAYFVALYVVQAVLIRRLPVQQAP